MAASYPDTIFVQTDSLFVVVFQSLIELKKQGRIRETYRQYALINPIASDNPEDPTLFGESHPQHFARTASSVIRMCMLEATGIEYDHWPQIGHNSQEENEKNLRFKCKVSPKREDQFYLENGSKDEARRYWSKYDQLHPHFLIQDKLSENYGREAELNSMMAIIRNDFTQVIEILTNFSVTCRKVETTDGNTTTVTYKYDSPRVQVMCIVLGIENNGKEDEESTQFLRRLIQPCQTSKVENFESELNAYVKKEMDVKTPSSGMTASYDEGQQQEQVKQEQEQDESGEGSRGGEEERKVQKEKEKKKK